MCLSLSTHEEVSEFENKTWFVKAIHALSTAGHRADELTDFFVSMTREDVPFIRAYMVDARDAVPNSEEGFMLWMALGESLRSIPEDY